VGILFLVIGGLDINQQESMRTADILNNTIVVIIFLITAINIVINSFGLRYTDEGVFPSKNTTTKIE
jgi:hypothetical protein